MFSLKNHPFAVDAFFEKSIVLTFAVPKQELESLIPECLTLDTFNNQYAFIAIAMVQTKNLRPKGLPKFLGNDFFLIGYRIFVRYTNPNGKILRGLYIIKSETNKAKMQFLGNLFTQYKYTKTDIQETKSEEKTSIKSIKSDFKVILNNNLNNVELPIKSPFQSWKEARKFAGPLPFTFTYNEKTNEILIIQGVRKHWKPKPINVDYFHFSFLNTLHFKNIQLANAFVINNIPYSWKKGKIERWKK